MLDVREPVEYLDGHVPGAVLLPLAQVLPRAGELPRGQTVFVICASGNRSRSASGWLRSVRVDAVSVAGGPGGPGGWRREGCPVVLRPHPNESAA